MCVRFYKLFAKLLFYEEIFLENNPKVGVSNV